MAGADREGLGGSPGRPVLEVTSKTRVGHLLAQRPQAAMVFVRRGMACPGCELNEFDTLAGAARSYGIPVDELIRSILE